jgi:PGF-pre-PGF domain-containing protein
LKKKSGRLEKIVLLLLFVLFVTSAFLAGTVTAVQGAEVEGVTRYAPAGPAPSAEFDVRLTITGEVPLVVGLVETIPEGFRFVSTTYEHYEDSGQEVAFAVINTTEITYRVEAPSSGEGTFTGTWTDMLSENKGSIADTIVIVGGGGAGAIEDDATSTPTPTPAAPAVKKASRNVPLLETGVEVAMVFENMDFALIALTADTDVSDAKVKVERVEQSAGIPEPSGIAYAFLEIEVENTEGATIEGRIECKVLKSWIADNSIDETTVTLCRFDEAEGWQVLATSKIREDNDFVYFEAVTPGFSLFAITGERAAAETPTPVATPTATPGALQIPNPAAKPTPIPTAPPPLATTTPTSELPGFGAIVTAISLLIVCLFVVVLRNKEQGGPRK